MLPYLVFLSAPSVVGLELNLWLPAGSQLIMAPMGWGLGTQVLWKKL